MLMNKNQKLGLSKKLNCYNKEIPKGLKGSIINKEKGKIN